MKRSSFILLLGLVVAVAGYSFFYFPGTTQPRAAVQSSPPELAWVKSEFKLSDSEFTKICQLHLDYMPHCKEMCDRIDKLNMELEGLVLQTNAITSDIEMKMTEASQLRLECQKMLLHHFYEVSRQMPLPQGKRYLTMMRQQTALSK
ncbi:MAG: hypothetical protein ABIV39_18600 [Verrucomicrobiota bacterium]